MTLIKAAALLAAGAAGFWLAMRALAPSEPHPSPHALDTWEGEGGNVAPSPSRIDVSALG